MSLLSAEEWSINIARAFLTDGCITHLRQIPEANDERTNSVGDPFTALHFPNCFHLPSIDIVFDTEFTICKCGMLFEGIDEVVG